jgi:hypothetical protein
LRPYPTNTLDSTTVERDVVKIEANCDWDSECALWVTVRSGEFRGRGMAWVDALDVVKFGASVSALANTGRGEAKLEGGYETREAYHSTVRLRIAPIGNRGYLRVIAEVVTDPNPDDPDVVHPVAAAIQVEPATL